MHILLLCLTKYKLLLHVTISWILTYISIIYKLLYFEVISYGVFDIFLLITYLIIILFIITIELIKPWPERHIVNLWFGF